MEENQLNFVNRVPIERPDFVNYFLAMAVVVSQRSHDAQTKHGCVIADKDNIPLSVGYNGFPRKMKDESLPNLRPEKYTWMVHAERNALANCQVRPKGATAYVTGQSCLDCGMALWAHGINKIYMIDGHGTVLYDDKMKNSWDIFIEQTGIEIIKIKPNFDWAKNIFDNY